jgi:spore maturation protein SpmA
MAEANGKTKVALSMIIPIIVTLILGIMNIWQWAGNKEHSEITRRVGVLEEAMMNDIKPDIAAIRQAVDILLGDRK